MSTDVDAPELAIFDVPQSDVLPDFLIDDGHWLGDATALRGAVLPCQGEARARGLLEMDSPRVFLGAAALTDSGIVERLAGIYGSERIGVFAPVVRMEVAWALEVQSNADFKTVAPSRCQPAWEIVDADGRRTGTDVHWWLGAMFERGASSAIVQVDILDDDDLNICAELIERFGTKVWCTPRSATANNFDDWIRWGKVARLALPFAAMEAASYAWLQPDMENAPACAAV
jgi:hypothetical protein